MPDLQDLLDEWIADGLYRPEDQNHCPDLLIFIAYMSATLAAGFPDNSACRNERAPLAAWRAGLECENCVDYAAARRQAGRSIAATARGMMGIMGEISEISGGLCERLRHVYWVGGASGAGKSTIARRLADGQGLRLYATDDVMADHARRSTAADSPFLSEFAAMDMDERWVSRPPEVMLETFHWFPGRGLRPDRR